MLYVKFYINSLPTILIIVLTRLGYSIKVYPVGELYDYVKII